MLAIWQRFKEFLGRVRLDRQLDEEVGFHLSMLEEQFRARGMSEAEAKAATRAVASILYGIQPSDPTAFVFTAVALAVTGLAAALLPARRAASLDPMRALRHE